MEPPKPLKTMINRLATPLKGNQAKDKQCLSAQSNKNCNKLSFPPPTSCVQKKVPSKSVEAPTLNHSLKGRLKVHLGSRHNHSLVTVCRCQGLHLVGDACLIYCTFPFQILLSLKVSNYI